MEPIPVAVRALLWTCGVLVTVIAVYSLMFNLRALGLI